jgi:hypothetical protein
MIKKFFVLSLVLVACAPRDQEKTVADSLAADAYEDFSEVSPFTIKDEVLSDTLVFNGKEVIAGALLETVYAPDTYTSHSAEDSIDAPKYIITEASVLEGDFFSAGGTCTTKTILVTGRGDFIDQEFYDLLFVEEDAGGRLILVDKLTFDGSQGQSSTMLAATAEDLSSTNDCMLLKVTSSSEGGDINLRKNEWVEYYIADEKSFRPILKVQTEDTSIQDYEAAESDNQSSSSELKEVEVLETSSKGLYDIRVAFVRKENGETILEGEEMYVFNGNEYVSK